MTYHAKCANEDLRRCGSGSNHLGDEVGRHTNDASETDHLEHSSNGEGKPEGAVLGCRHDESEKVENVGCLRKAMLQDWELRNR